MIGVDDERTGAAVKLIVRRDPNLTEEGVRARALQNLTGDKLPRSVEFRDQLPKSNIGKGR